MGIFTWLDSHWSRGRRLRRLVMPTGHHDTALDNIKRAASADVEAMEEEKREFFDPNGPGEREDDL